MNARPYPGQVLTSSVHKGRIVADVVFHDGSVIGRKLLKSGAPSRREVAVPAGAVIGFQLLLPGVGRSGGGHG
jgi:hypothetical protein